MSILNNLLGANVDPMQQQLAALLGVQVDPASLQRRARQQGLSRIGQALMQAGGGAGGTLAALGQGLQSAQGSGDDLLGQEIQRTMQFRQLQEQQMALKQRAAMQEQLKQVLPNALKGMDPDQAQLMTLMVSSGDPNAMQSVLKMLTEKPKGPSNKAQLALAAAQGDKAAQAALDRLNADELARAQAGRTSVNVDTPDIGAIINAAGKAFGKGGGEAFSALVDEANKKAQGLSQYAANVRQFNQVAGGDQVVGGSLGVKAKEVVSGLGLGDAFGIDQEALARQRAAQNLSSKIGIEELANLSGPDTDKDFERVVEAGPALQQTPQGRALFQQITEAKAKQAQQIAAFANQQAQQVEAGAITVEQARENIRRENERTLVTPLFDEQINALTGKPDSTKGAAPAVQPPAAGAKPKRYRFNADGTMTEV